MQEGCTENIGWSIYFDSSRDQLSYIYHTQEDKNRLCGSMCCQKKDVLFTHPTESVIIKLYTELKVQHEKYQYSPEVVEMRAEIYSLKEQKLLESKRFLRSNLENVKDTMLEYLI